MKSSFSLTRLLALSLILTLFVISCGKENSLVGTDAQEEELATASGESSGEAENTFSESFDDVMGVSNEVGVAGSGVFFGRPDTLTPVARCFTVTVTHPSNTPFPVHVVVDFGTTGCTGPDGHVRRGKIITDYTNRLVYPGAIATTNFDGFYVDSVHVEGTHKISNISTGSSSRIYKVEVINGKLTKPSGNYIEWNSTKTITQIEGLSTLDPRDDVYKIEGSARGKAKRGNLIVGWESTITEPLIRRVTCRWIVKGRIRTVRVNLPNPGTSPWIAVLDFGTGNCDNLATLTINGITHQITLP
jgi:hypothetical protein